MDLMKHKVKHVTFGCGTVIEQSDGYFTVSFASRTSTFVYPDAFTNFLRVEDELAHAQVLNEIETINKEKERNKEITHIVTEERRAAADEAKRIQVSPKTLYRPKPVAGSQRVAGKRMTFFVFQGSTFDIGYRGGYIWAPIMNKDGDTFHHWDRLLDVHSGDIILHGCDGFVKAISIARTACYECLQPEKLSDEHLWDQEGRRVDCDYIYVEHPIKTATFVDDILRLCNIKYAPFDKDGNGNMGYLYELNRELARIFLRASIKQNSYLRSVDFIQELVSEADQMA